MVAPSREASPAKRPAAGGTAVAEVLWGIGVFVAVLLAHGFSPIETSFDSRWTIHTALSMVRDGDTALDQWEEFLRHDDYYAIERIDGHLYNRYPVGPSLFAVPAVALLELRAKLLGRYDTADLLRAGYAGRIEVWVASTIVAATAVLLFAIGRERGLRPAGAALLAGVFAFATSAWSTGSRGLWQHTPAMFLLAAAIHLFLRARERPAYGALAGFVLALGVVVRPTGEIPLVVLGAYLLFADPRRFAGFAVLAAVVLVPFIAWNLRLYGQWIGPYYHPSGQRVGRLAALPAVLAGHLISPNRGLLVFSPVLIFSIAGVAHQVRCRTLTRLDVALLMVVALHLVVISTAEQWWAGHSFGARYLTDVVPILVYFLIPFLDWLRQAVGGPRVALVGAFAALLAWSVFAQLRAATTWDVWAWNADPVSIDDAPTRAWDWSDLQILHGLGARRE